MSAAPSPSQQALAFLRDGLKMSATEVLTLAVEREAEETGVGLVRLPRWYRP